MIYKNIENKSVYVSINMTKTKVNPNEIVNLSIRDIKHSGSSIRFLKAMNKINSVDKEKMDVVEGISKDVSKLDLIDNKKVKSDKVKEKENAKNRKAEKEQGLEDVKVGQEAEKQDIHVDETPAKDVGQQENIDQGQHRESIQENTI